ncbi:molybdenum cofactor guanylyltransferase [Pseudodesulfovibrio senegalensis]|jgi:molybdopterin-guanine dinucleotide biosynthesis protein A|uniref:Probable molybdenum cofactor guanylyltransferase n=1 Tax=Pseudodesulfovibrio senegalensis TaxID=1721087 RepID=A0A6N6N3C2_9BACT|nr:molybdenum cofactor guanylyltransferase [Pseudodesulfovibrio senegalensis]KAB1441542.1 molybdenum cofactor guanylyltransferase [Pseudodesulfovibrio senegalensis]
MHNTQISAIILAGGKGSRLGNVNKAFLKVGSTRIIDRLLAVCTPMFTDIVIACRDTETFALPGVRAVADHFDIRSSLTGLHAGLEAITGDRAFVTACDAPFLHPEMVRLLVRESAPQNGIGPDITIPLKEDGYHEPLCAVYSTRCLPHIEAQLRTGNLKITDFFGQMNLKNVPADKLRAADPDLRSFMGVNTPQELEQARKR